MASLPVADTPGPLLEVVPAPQSLSAPAPTPTPAHAASVRPSLERLPNELLEPIAAGLVPASPLTTRFALRPTGTWEFRDAHHQWADWLAGHNELLAFAQTSQRMAAIAKPLLYRTIVIHNEHTLVTLFLRLSRRPEIKPWIREITCLVNVAGVLTLEEVHREWERQTGVKWQPMPGGTDATIALDLLRAILLNAPNLEDLLIAFPDHELAEIDPSSAGTDFLMPTFRYALLRYITEAYPAAFTDAVARFFPFEFMKNLKSLRIYCHREEGDRDLSFSRLLADYAISALPLLTNLKTLELCCSSAGNLIAGNDQIPPLPGIENLRLYGSHIHEPRLVALCLACVNLQSLLVHFEASSTDEERDALPDGKTLNDALVGLAGSLRTLELVALSEGHYLTRGRERPRKPENHRLTCIPELRCLENLTLDYRGIFGTLGILEEDDGERLCHLLPSSLRHFTLVCEWGTAKDWKQSYLANLTMVLYGVECLCATQSPRLSSISLAIHSWPAKSRFHRRFEREVLEARQRCARAGTRFRTFDLLPCYQDEDEMEPAEEGDLEDEEGGAEDEFDDVADEDEIELEEEDEASEYYFSGDEESDPEREARRPPTFDVFLERLGEDHGHSLDELFYAYHEDRWDEYLF
ncbi:hypothetical protein B0T26DRAFT_755371 [Lasiosphaeria miniovina]|uniref:F-box domain-containing protein n=1 Tax=Lasiosphaeria miniovina TaxID=1954250 RepID=A0AA40A6M7_9PEZI|nr:uncharacterized protein B0T26DRAFT_755371 [Lasiosphaeria miniovina]KAK0710289.1 hypothetical protein B0T26DRAFT_755371 [Lasiosphaeria miniovina]